MILRAALLAAACGSGPANALTLSFPVPAVQTADEVREAGGADLPVAPFEGGTVPRRGVEGQVTRQAWRLPSRQMTTEQIAAPLRAQLRQAEFDVVFDCRDKDCGGYDFRFAADVLGEPAMHVDLGDYRYLMAENDAGAAVALMISRSPSAGFVQLTQVGPAETVADAVVTSSKSDAFAPRPAAETAAEPTPAVSNPTDLARLVDTGRLALDDLRFATGSASLQATDTASLQALASFLAENPERTLTLVGHTDAEGALDANIALSRRRAQAVRTALLQDHGVPAAQVRAEGVGYLAPRARNATKEGRLANRRVEAILTD